MLKWFDPSRICPIARERRVTGNASDWVLDWFLRNPSVKSRACLRSASALLKSSSDNTPSSWAPKISFNLS